MRRRWAAGIALLLVGCTTRRTAVPQPLAWVDLPAGAAPAIHGPGVIGTTPGRPFLFRIPATGKAPLRFSAAPLPPGLTLDPATGVISGSVAGAGTTRVAICVTGPAGAATRDLMLVAGRHRLALTPPMGWNSWNAWGPEPTAARIEAAADELVRSGLAAHGYRYVIVDDGWQGARGKDGILHPSARFGDMAAVAAHVHSLGLEFGIYTSPGPMTCANFPGSLGHEAVDAATFAGWGADYLKYDWCSYAALAKGKGIRAMIEPYARMRAALDRQPRDIVYAVCQYGLESVWKWAPEVRANTWRTTEDLTDSWRRLNRVAFRSAGYYGYAGPGHWNDPDMLVVGRVGWGKPHRCRLTPSEQILHMSMWALQAAPLILGCDLSHVDRFTRMILTNDEVIAVDQDPRGEAAHLVGPAGVLEVWARPLCDGSEATGLFNRTDSPERVTVRWKDLGLRGPRQVRDLWLHRDLGSFPRQFSAMTPAHGCVMVRVTGRDNRSIRRRLSGRALRGRSAAKAKALLAG